MPSKSNLQATDTFRGKYGIREMQFKFGEREHTQCGSNLVGRSLLTGEFALSLKEACKAKVSHFVSRFLKDRKTKNLPSKNHGRFFIDTIANNRYKSINLFGLWVFFQ